MSTSPKGPSRQWRKLKEPVLDDEIRAAVALGLNKAHPPGEHDYDRRFYETLFYGSKSKADVAEDKRGLYRAAKRLGFSLMTKEDSVFGGHGIWFTPICKECGTAYHIKTNGTDRTKWSYDPLRKRNEQDHE